MKIIAKSNSGYLVEATAQELANCAGFRNTSELSGWNRREYELILGTIIKPDETFAYLQSLREHEGKCKSSAAFLRGMADMLEGALPTTVIPAETVAEVEK